MFTVATAADYAAAVLRDADTDPAVFCNVAAVSAAVETLIGSKRPERRAEGERPTGSKVLEPLPIHALGGAEIPAAGVTVAKLAKAG